MSHTYTICRAVPRGTLRQPAGFTLIELMVVVALLVLIASMTIGAVNLNTNSDKVRAGSRQVQSYLAGARDRAIYSKAPRGVRFLLDSSSGPTVSSRTVSSMVFIAPTDPWTQGTIQLERLDIDGTPGPDYLDSDLVNGGARVLRGFDNDPNSTDWYNLVQQGLLKPGSRIRIPANNGVWYVVENTTQVTPTNPRLRLTTPYEGSSPKNPDATDVAALASGTGPSTYLLELPPSVLPNQDPVLMPKGSVIHLDRCTTVNSTVNNLEQQSASASASNRGDKLPDAWKRSPSTATPPDTSGFDYRSDLDVMFSPRGVVIGPAAQRGIIHLYICDQKDADLDRQYWASASSYPTASAPESGPWTTYAVDPKYERGDKVILSLFTRTGAVSTHHIYSNIDPFKYAETGEVAGK